METAATYVLLSATVPSLHCRSPLEHVWLLGSGLTARAARSSPRSCGQASREGRPARCCAGPLRAPGLVSTPAPAPLYPSAQSSLEFPTASDSHPLLCLFLLPAFSRRLRRGPARPVHSSLSSGVTHSSGGGVPVTDLHVHCDHTADTLPGCSFGPETPTFWVPATLMSLPCTHRSRRDVWSP